MGERVPGWHGAASSRAPVLPRRSGDPHTRAAVGLVGRGQPAPSWPGQPGVFTRQRLAVGRNVGDSPCLCTETPVLESWGPASPRELGKKQERKLGFSSACAALASVLGSWGKGGLWVPLQHARGLFPAAVNQPCSMALWRGTGCPVQSLASRHRLRGLDLSSLRARSSNTFKPIGFSLSSVGLPTSYRLSKCNISVRTETPVAE